MSICENVKLYMEQFFVLAKNVSRETLYFSLIAPFYLLQLFKS